MDTTHVTNIKETAQAPRASSPGAAQRLRHGGLLHHCRGATSPTGKGPQGPRPRPATMTTQARVRCALICHSGPITACGCHKAHRTIADLIAETLGSLVLRQVMTNPFPPKFVWRRSRGVPTSVEDPAVGLQLTSPAIGALYLLVGHTQATTTSERDNAATVAQSTPYTTRAEWCVKCECARCLSLHKQHVMPLFPV